MSFKFKPGDLIEHIDIENLTARVKKVELLPGSRNVDSMFNKLYTIMLTNEESTKRYVLPKDIIENEYRLANYRETSLWKAMNEEI